MGYLFTLLALPGATEWVLIAAVILLIFGGKKIPELMRGLGTGIKEFKNATKDDDQPSEKDQTPKNIS